MRLPMTQSLLNFDSLQSEFREFVLQNNLDIISTDLLDRRNLERIGAAGGSQKDLISGLRGLQRILRIEPDCAIATLLLSHGMDSAHRITAMSRSRFVQRFADELGPQGTDRARRIYDKARVVKARVSNLVASLHGSIASRHATALAGSNISDDLANYFQTLSSYQTLFGSLNYCDPGNEVTILSPAAYLVDLLRVIDLAITVPNTTRPSAKVVMAARLKYDIGGSLSPDESRTLFEQNIPPGLSLNERRPDLGNILLTTENTFDEIPYLQIVVQVLLQSVTFALKKSGVLQQADVFFTLANIYYPFNLPSNRPLARMRNYLAAKKGNLSDVYSAFTIGPAYTIDEAAEYLGLSFEQLINLEPLASGSLDQKVSANYGLSIKAGSLAGMDNLEQFLAQTGLGLSDVTTLFLENLSAQEIFDTSGSYQTTGLSNSLTLVQQSGRVSGTFGTDGTLEGVLDGLVVNGYWQQSTNNVPQAGEFQFTFATDGASFQGHWRVGYGGDWETTPWDGSRDASTATVSIIPHSFFINKVLAVRQYLQTFEQTNGSETTTMIEYQSVATLDTINRFVRLAALLEWAYPDLDWVLNTLNAPTVDNQGNLTCATELTEATFIELAKIKRLTGEYGLPLELATSMWFDIRTINCGPTEVSAAPFDIIFNSPDVLRQFPARTIYHPVIAAGASSYVNPLYKDAPRPWTVGAAPSNSSGVIANAIVAAIPSSTDNITAIATAVFGASTPIDLTVTNLSVLYRHTTLAQQLNLPVAAYIQLLGLLGLTRNNGNILAALTRDQLLATFETVTWINDCGIAISDLGYLITGVAGPYASPGYDPANVPALVGALVQTLKPTLTNTGAFASPDITDAESAAYFQVLVNTGYIDPIGIILKDAGAARPDLSTAVIYDPAVTAPTPPKVDYVVKVLRQQAKSQLEPVAQQLAAFFGSTTDTITAALTASANWLGLESAVEPFALTPLFQTPSADVKTGGLLDETKVATAFVAHEIVLSADVSMVPQTAAAWSIVDTPKNLNFAAVTPDLLTMVYYQGNTILFRGAVADVMTAGSLDPAKLVVEFADNKIILSGPPTVTMTAAPLSTVIEDNGNSVSYFATQYGDASAAVSFLAASTASPALTGPVANMVRMVSQFLVVNASLPLSNQALTTLGTNPAAFGFSATIGEPVAMSLDGIYGIYVFRQLIAAFHDTSDLLANYLGGVSLAPNAAAADVMLCAVTGWDLAQCTYVRTKLFGAAVAAADIGQINSLNRIFTQATLLGTDVYLLSQISDTALAPATPQGYATLDALAGRLLEAIQAKTTAEAWPTVVQQINSPLLELERDALVPVAVWQLGQQFTDITTARALYEFLLIDVEMSGCAQISSIKEALNAAQLYLQRCRLNLERNVIISTDDLPNVWWEWLLNYRIWQANREIFLYPENYIDPSLRPTKTQLFQTLENDLLQGDVTPDRVEAEFRKYLNGLAELAKLTIVDSCHAVVHDKERGELDTLFLFARTSTQPYKFYYIKRERVANCQSTGNVWSEWLPIKITINSEDITSVYAFGKLLIFWNELTDKKELDGTGDPNKRATVSTAGVNYSFQSFTGDWMQPQTLVADLPVDVTGLNLNLYGPFSLVFASTPDAMWAKIACLHIPVTAFPDGTEATEKLCVYFGPIVNMIPITATGPPDPSTYAQNPEVQSFAQSIVQADFVATQLQGLTQTGKTPLFQMIVLDSMLEPGLLTSDTQYLTLQDNNLAQTIAPSFQPGLNGSSLVAQSSSNSLLENYITGLGVTIPFVTPQNSVVSANSFTSDYVSAAQSQQFFTTMTTAPNNLIDASGHVSGTITALSVQMLQTVLNSSGVNISIGVAWQVREAMLDAFFGTEVLMTNASAGNTQVMPVNNQPGAFILTSGAEDFLVEAATVAGAEFPMLDQAVGVKPVNPAGRVTITPAAFITRDISIDQAFQFYSALVSSPAGFIKANGVVNTTLVTNTSVEMLALSLTTDIGRAQVVKNILLSATGPSYAAYSGTKKLDDTPAIDFQLTDSLYTLQFNAQRLTSNAIDHLSAALNAGGIDALLALDQQQLPVNILLPFDQLGPNPGKVPLNNSAPLIVPPTTYYGEQVSFDGPYGLYFWELFFHSPLLVAEMLQDNQQFQAAETWLQYIFNPTLPPDPLTLTRFISLSPDDITQTQATTFYSILTTAPNQMIDANGKVSDQVLNVSATMMAATLSVSLTQGREILNLLLNQYLTTPTGRYWRFQPFRNHTLESLKDQLTNCAEIAAYNDDPFDPDAIARLRIGAYEKTVVMTYIKNLLAWGDSEFSMYIWEALVTARMLYSYALDLLGPRPVDLGPCEQVAPTTFNIILARYGGDPSDIPQFLIDMENAMPGAAPDGPLLAQSDRPFNDLGGVFVVPENDNLLSLWDQVDDRLNKIRNCLNINGQPQPLALFQPPIDPMALVRAAAAGNNLMALESQLQPQVPYYRFSAMIQRAGNAVQTLRSLGASMLQALEQNDAEGLANLRATHEISILNMMTMIKRKAIEDLEAQLQSMEETLLSSQYRQSYYNDLISQNLIAPEIAALTLMSRSIVERVGALAFNGLAIGGYLVPNIFGLADGGMKFGDAINAGAQIAGSLADIMGQGASISQTVGEYQRRAADWTMQSNLAGYEIAGTTGQIDAINARIAGAQQDLATHLQQIDYATQELQYLTQKFTNQQLYGWMIGRLATLYFQSYRLTQELALAAQTCYQYEMDTDDQIVTFNYWDSLRRGLLAGEGLALALDQLQKAYADNDSRLLEIEKTISLRQNFPAAFFGFIWGYGNGNQSQGQGKLNFVLPEALFDFDFPNHYCRKVKVVSISIPCVIGPYQELHATLMQNGNAVVMAPNLAAVKYVAQKISSANTQPADPPAGTVRENWISNQAIAISQGVDDDGMFVLNFDDQQYLPFEGTGAVSAWTFSMPPETNAIDFNSISDVIIKVRYTAKDGGYAFAQQVKQYYNQQANTNPRLINAAFMLSRMFATQWFQMMNTPPSVNKTQTITFPVGSSIVLPNLRNVKLNSVIVQLELSDKAGGPFTSSAGKSFLGLQINGNPTEPTPIDITNNFGSIGPATFGTALFSGVPWSLVFDLNNIPSQLLNKDGTLDTTKLLDVGMVVIYSASPF
jgi:hypothetical protein